MKFIADVNVEKRIVEFLRNNGYDVLWMLEDENTLDDQSILIRANKESRILITNDKDFGEIVYRQKLLSYGIILFRINGQSVSKKMDMLERLLKKEQEIINRFVVIKENKIRILRLE